MSDKEPLITHIYTADPSANVFNGTLYIYPSHDIPTNIRDNDNGDQYAMEDYHVFSMRSIPGPVTDHGVVLSASSIPWVSKQLWAPDACTKNGKYYLYFPARDKEGVFRIGVAVGDKPEGPFTPDENPIPGSYSIDPCSFVDDDGQAYLYFGGIWGGQLQCWGSQHEVFEKEKYDTMEPSSGFALGPRVAKLSADMHSFSSPTHEISILDEVTGEKISAADHERRFFEAAWMHKYGGKYYFSYSTGDTHFLCFAVGERPEGPFVYKGRLLEPVVGWTTHHSIVEFPVESGRWWLFYHDASLSGGKNHLRCVKVREVFYDEVGGMRVE